MGINIREALPSRRSQRGHAIGAHSKAMPSGAYYDQPRSLKIKFSSNGNLTPLPLKGRLSQILHALTCADAGTQLRLGDKVHQGSQGRHGSISKAKI